MVERSSILEKKTSTPQNLMWSSNPNPQNFIENERKIVQSKPQKLLVEEKVSPLSNSTGAKFRQNDDLKKQASFSTLQSPELQNGNFIIREEFSQDEGNFRKQKKTTLEKVKQNNQELNHGVQGKFSNTEIDDHELKVKKQNGPNKQTTTQENENLLQYNQQLTQEKHMKNLEVINDTSLSSSQNQLCTVRNKKQKMASAYNSPQYSSQNIIRAGQFSKGERSPMSRAHHNSLNKYGKQNFSTALTNSNFNSPRFYKNGFTQQNQLSPSERHKLSGMSSSNVFKEQEAFNDQGYPEAEEPQEMRKESKNSGISMVQNARTQLSGHSRGNSGNYATNKDIRKNKRPGRKGSPSMMARRDSFKSNVLDYQHEKKRVYILHNQPYGNQSMTKRRSEVLYRKKREKNQHRNQSNTDLRNF